MQSLHLPHNDDLATHSNMEITPSVQPVVGVCHRSATPGRDTANLSQPNILHTSTYTHSLDHSIPHSQPYKRKPSRQIKHHVHGHTSAHCLWLTSWRSAGQFNRWGDNEKSTLKQIMAAPTLLASLWRCVCVREAHQWYGGLGLVSSWSFHRIAWDQINFSVS